MMVHFLLAWFFIPTTKLWPALRLALFHVQPEIMCAQLLLHPLMDFVHTHTQWPTWYGDDLKDGTLRYCKFYM